jgi:hypothetical protein
MFSTMHPPRGNRGCLQRRTRSVNPLPCTAAPKVPEVNAYVYTSTPTEADAWLAAAIRNLELERQFFGESL